MVETEGTKTAFAIAEADWVAGSIVLTMEGEEQEVILPPLNNLKRCDALPASVSALSAEAVAIFKRLDELEAACTGGESIAARCIEVASGMIDVSGDGVFSRAELSRVIRAAGFFIGYRLAVVTQRDAAARGDGADEARGPAFVAPEDVYLAQLAVAVSVPSLPPI